MTATQTLESQYWDYEAALRQVAAAASAVHAAEGHLQAARRLRDEAVADGQRAAGRVANLLADASAAGIQPHESWWGEIAHDAGIAGMVSLMSMAAPIGLPIALGVEALRDGGANYIKHHWVGFMKDASTVLAGISTVAGLLSLIPIVGEVALPVAILTALGATVVDATLWKTGKGVTLGNLALDLAGDISFGAGGALGRLAEGMTRLGEASHTIVAAKAEIEVATKAVADTSRENQALHAFSRYTVPILSRNGPTQWTKVADLARESDTRLTSLHTALETADQNQKLAEATMDHLGPKLGGAVQKSHYALGGVAGADDSVVAKVAKSVSHPALYYRGSLDALGGAGSSTRSITDAFNRLAFGPGWAPYHASLALGIAGTNMGGIITLHGAQDWAARS